MSKPSLVLASKSVSRRAMLDAAGVPFEVVPADIDERAVERGLAGVGAAEIAEALSVAKAQAVAEHHPGRLVLGSDSLVVVEETRFDKPSSREEAIEHLRFFSGRVMQLHSAAALVCDNVCEWSRTECAQLHVRSLSERFIESYLEQEWPEVSATVGVFRIEALGVQLFERIEGDQFTVLGMPLLPLLSALRDQGMLVR